MRLLISFFNLERLFRNSLIAITTRKRTIVKKLLVMPAEVRWLENDLITKRPKFDYVRCVNGHLPEIMNISYQLLYDIYMIFVLFDLMAFVSLFKGLFCVCP